MTSCKCTKISDHSHTVHHKTHKRLLAPKTGCQSHEISGVKRDLYSEGKYFVQHNARANPVKYWEHFRSIALLSLNLFPPWAAESWKKSGREQCWMVIKDEGVTVRVRQGDAVLSGHEDLSYVTQRYLRSWILINNQVDRLDAGAVQIL